MGRCAMPVCTERRYPRFLGTGSLAPVKDQLVASYPVVVAAIDQPTDEDFIERVKKSMRSYYSSDDIKTARFIVR
jgi:hypothetical protein